MTSTEDEIKIIQERNKRVALDKAWETSMTRRIFIAMITYVIATVFLWRINSSLFYVNALVPAGGYLLSTLSLPWIRNKWINLQKKQF